jgi:hypothetical protein
MDVKQAVHAAKLFVREVFAEENPTDILLEEIEFQEDHDQWNVTIGFTRKLDEDDERGLPRLRFPEPRVMKVLSISDSSMKLISVRNRGGMN